MVAKFRKIKKGRNVFFSLLLGTIFLMVIGFLIATNWKISQRRAKLISRIDTLKKEIQIFEERNKELQAGISQASSEVFLEKEAREKLGLKKPGEEVVVVLPLKEDESKEVEKEKNFWQRLLEKFGL